jgi:chromosome condensin MukBEF ATPase and DNA-binding subunit MukB
MQLRQSDEHSHHISNVEKKLVDYDEKLISKDKELNDFKAAYKEKLRKCQAWEKAYNSLRNQIQESGDKANKPAERQQVSCL